MSWFGGGLGRYRRISSELLLACTVSGHVTCMFSLSGALLSSEDRLVTSILGVQTVCCYAATAVTRQKLSSGDIVTLCILINKLLYLPSDLHSYTGCNRRNGPDFGRVFLMLNYTEKPQNTYIQS